MAVQIVLFLIIDFTMFVEKLLICRIIFVKLKLIQ